MEETTVRAQPIHLSFTLSALLLTVGCPETPCVEDLDETCTPLSSDVSWSNVYSTVIAEGCAQGGTSCHSADGVQGGLSLADEETAWSQLVETTDSDPAVIPSDASCSDLMKRIESGDPNYQMPVGSPLSAAERCMVQLWIDNGAPR